MVSSVITSRAVLLISLLQVLPVAAVPAASNLDSPIPGYGIEEIVWAVHTAPGSPTVNVTGTVQDVIQYAERVNPGFRSDFALDQQPPKNERFEIESIHCEWTGYMSARPIKDGISDLRSASGTPIIAPGPRNCAKVSCKTWDDPGAIYWCNDNEESKELDSYGTIAEATQKLMDKCQTGTFVSGQIFLKDHWNVILRGENAENAATHILVVQEGELSERE